MKLAIQKFRWVFEEWGDRNKTSSWKMRRPIEGWGDTNKIGTWKSQEQLVNEFVK